MRQITRCPACGTLFRVVADQLKISGGWVRCGHCAEVFDAPAHFFEPPAVPASEASSLVPHTRVSAADVPSALPEDPQPMAESIVVPVDSSAVVDADVPAVAVPVAEVPVDIDLAVDAAPGTETDAGADSVTPSELQAWRRRREEEVQAEAEALERAIESRDPQERAVAQGPDAGIHDEAVAPVEADVDVSPQPVEADGPPSGEDEPAPAFVRQADRRAFWRRPRVRALMSVLVLLLLGVMGAQLIYVERDRMAAYLPVARPWLERACAAMGCEVGALRQIESVLVDGSSFTRLRPDAYRLGLVLRSSARVDIAMPSVELTLTSVQGQTLLRRVLSPSDLGAPATIRANSEWVGDLPLTLEDPQVASRVAGYTVLPFYP